MLVHPPRNYWGLTKQIGPFSNTPQDEANLALGYSNMYNQNSTIRPFQQDGSGSFIATKTSPLVCPENEELPMKPKLGKRFKLSLKKLSALVRRDKPLPNVFSSKPPPPLIPTVSEPSQGMLTVSEGSYTLSPFVFNPSTASGSFYVPSSNSGTFTTGTGSLNSASTDPSTGGSYYVPIATIPDAAEAATNSPFQPQLQPKPKPGLTIDIPTSPDFPSVPTNSPGKPGGKIPSPFTYSPSVPLWAALKLPGTTGASVSPNSSISPTTTDSDKSLSPWLINGYLPFTGNTSNPIVQTTPLVISSGTTGNTMAPSNTWGPLGSVDDYSLPLFTNQDIVMRERQQEASAELFDRVSAQVKTNLAVRTNRASHRVNPYPKPGKKSTRVKRQANPRSAITSTTGEAPPTVTPPPVTVPLNTKVKGLRITIPPYKPSKVPRGSARKTPHLVGPSLLGKRKATTSIVRTNKRVRVGTPLAPVLEVRTRRKSTRVKKQANPRSAMGDYK